MPPGGRAALGQPLLVTASQRSRRCHIGTVDTETLYDAAEERVAVAQGRGRGAARHTDPVRERSLALGMAERGAARAGPGAGKAERHALLRHCWAGSRHVKYVRTEGAAKTRGSEKSYVWRMMRRGEAWGIGLKGPEAAVSNPNLPLPCAPPLPPSPAPALARLSLHWG